MSNNFKPSLRDLLMANLIINKCKEDNENPKYFLRLLNISKNTRNKSLIKPNNLNKEPFLNKNIYKKDNGAEKEKEKNFKIKLRESNLYKRKNYITKLSSHFSLLYPLSKMNIKKSIRYIYDNNNYYKKKENKNNLGKEILYIEKYDENKNKEHFIKSFSFTISKDNSEKRNRNLKNEKNYIKTQGYRTENEENNKSINKNDDNTEQIKIRIDNNINKLIGNNKINQNQFLSKRDNINHNFNNNINKIKNMNILNNINKNDKEKISIDKSKNKIDLSARNKLDLKFIFKNDNEKNKKNGKKELNVNNRNVNNLRILDYEYKYDKNLESKMKPKNLIQTFDLKKYKFKNYLNNNKNYFSNKNIPIKLAQMLEIKNHLVNYDNKSSIIQKYLSNKYIEYILFNKNVINNVEKYYYKINKMYSKQLKEYMKHRINWIPIDDNLLNNSNESITINFQWKYYSNRLNFKEYKYDINTPSKKLRMVNVFEKNSEIGNKKNMFINLLTYSDKININAFDLVPLTIIISNSKDIDNCLEALRDLINFVEKKKSIGKDLITNRKYNEHFWYDKNFEMLKKQYININKNFLSEQNYWIIKPIDLYQGKCIEICNDYEQIEKKCKNLFRGVDKRIMPELLLNADEEISEEENCLINSSIINNNSGSDNEIKSEGNNIENSNLEINNSNNLNINTNNIINTFNNSTIKKNSNNKKKKINSRMYCSNEIIIQKYLDNPLLYQKRKFDIRCFVLVDSNLNVYFCREGHLKSSSKIYDLNSNDKFIHITNHSLQKKCSKFAQYEYGNEMSYDDFKKALKKDNISLEKFYNMIEEMKYLIKISFKSVGNKLLKTNPVLCFEIFGYDFILDNDFKLWILEINNNPGLGISSPVIFKLVPRMLDDAFRLTIDKIFETKYSNDCIDENGKYKSKYQLDGFTDDENVFEFLCNVK